MREPVIIEASGPARLACVLVHGRGQSPGDLAPLTAAAQAAGARIVMPVAVGKSWYTARAVDPLTPQTLEELNRALDLLHAAVQAAHDPALPLMLAGFSQGACLSAEYLLRRGGADGLCILTGARVGTRADGLPVARRPGIPVYLTGADADPWIPLDAYEGLAADLHRSGARLRCDLFPGRAHEISAPEVAVFAAMAEALASARQPFESAA